MAANLTINGVPQVMPPTGSATFTIPAGAFDIRTTGPLTAAVVVNTSNFTATISPTSIILSGSMSGVGAVIGGGSMRLTGTAASPGTITVTAAPSQPNAGPATDFAINPYINNPTGGTVNAANTRRTLHTIGDGASNTFFLGHAYCARDDYPLTTPLQSSRLPIFQGGTLATARNGLGDTPATWLQDGTAATLNQWGSPMVEGGLFALADGSVRMLPYSFQLTNLLYPSDGNVIQFP